MERSVDEFLDAIDNLDFSQEYPVIYTISILKARLVMNKCSYEEMKRINLEDNGEIFYSFEEENRITLKEYILTSLEIIQDRCKTNSRTKDWP